MASTSHTTSLRQRMIDDMQARKLGPALAAGCPVVCVRDGYNQGVPAEELGADSVIESFLDLV